jgi:hypothetical protein
MSYMFNNYRGGLMPKIQVYYKSNYGNVLCYPYCDRAKTFIKLTGYKTFNDYHLAQIRQLGYDIVYVPFMEGL